MVRFLVTSGADVNRKNLVRGETPLMAATGAGRLGTAKVLLSHGADPCLTSKEGLTAEGLAKKYNHGELVEYLSVRFPCTEDAE